MMTTGIKTTIANITFAAAAVTTVACGAQTPSQTPTQVTATNAAPGNGQVMVNCGPGQQAMIRPVLMNGQSVSQVECVAVAAPAGQQVAYAQPQPLASGTYAQVAYQPSLVPVAAPQPTYVSYEPAPTAAPAPQVVRAPSNVRKASYRTSGDYVQYEPVRKPARDWKKSAIVIGSTAGIGAGVGAAAGGKKGALIGAAIGGGGAAIWDQMTRRKE